MIIEVTAPGKTVLHGEHAVVYGKAAIAASLGIKTRVTYCVNEGQAVCLKLKLLNFETKWDVGALSSIKYCSTGDEIKAPDEDCLSEIEKFLKETNTLQEGSSQFHRLAVIIFLFLYTSIGQKYCNGFTEACTITVESELSVGAGMGSSASYSVCLSAALLAASRKMYQLSESDKELVSKYAFCAECICHGSPSGMDNSICTYGGALLFQDGAIKSILSRIPPLKILLVDTGVPRSTKLLVTKVKDKLKAHPKAMEQVIDAINSITLESWSLLQKMVEEERVDVYMSSLQELVDMNHHLLNCLGVGHFKLDRICGLAQKYGCVGKLTGAGGGGCAIILLNSDTDTKSLKSELTAEGFKYWDILLGDAGVNLHIKHA